MPHPIRFFAVSAVSLRRSQARGGFTLIELLTVIAVIGVLVAILIPVVGVTRASARKAECTSNQRQIVTALRLHAAENRDMLPITNIESGSPWTRSETFLAYLPMQQRGGSGSGKWEHPVLICPSVSRPTDGASVMDIRETYNSSAAMNGPNAEGELGMSETVPRRLVTITNPASTPILIEGKLIGPTYVNSGYFARWGSHVRLDLGVAPDATRRLDYPHRGAMNVAMVDGSVRSWTPADFVAKVDELVWRGVK